MQSCVFRFGPAVSSVCFVSKITFAILPKSAADFLHTGSPWAARADNKIKYYVPTINTNCIALYEYRVEYTRTYIEI